MILTGKSILKPEAIPRNCCAMTAANGGLREREHNIDYSLDIYMMEQIRSQSSMRKATNTLVKQFR